MSMKWAAPLRKSLRHVYTLRTPARPHTFAVHASGTLAAEQSASDLSVGQRIAESTAARIGSWRFIGAQAAVMAVWVLWNVLAPLIMRYDQYPFVFLNLAMSAEAAFTGPVLLIAAAVGALRDHAQANRIEALEQQLAERDAAIAQLAAQLNSKLDTLVAAALLAQRPTSTSMSIASSPPPAKRTRKTTGKTASTQTRTQTTGSAATA